MIRINLLAAEPLAAGRTRTGAGPGTAGACGVIVLGVVLGLMMREGLAIRGESNRLDQRVRVLDRQLAELAGVSARREEVERRGDDLAGRVARTEALRAAQGAPVRLLDQVGRALPDDAWLTELRQRGDEVTLTGRVTGMTGLTALVAGLESSGYFPPPIEIVDSRWEGEGSAEAVHFEIRARFALPSS